MRDGHGVVIDSISQVRVDGSAVQPECRQDVDAVPTCVMQLDVCEMAVGKLLLRAKDCREWRACC